MKWIIGDVHGCLDTMLALMERVKEKDSGAEFIFTGDFVDRGPNSKGVLEYILPRIDSGEFRAVKGNHEEIMYNGIHHPFRSNWDGAGGIATKDSYYGEHAVNLEPAEIDRLIVESEYLMVKHADKISELPYYLILDEKDEKGRNLLISHAFCADYIDDYLSLYGPDATKEDVQKYEDEFGLMARCSITKKGDLFNRNRNLPEKEETGYFNITGHNITGQLLDKYKVINGYDEETEVIIDKDLGYACIDTGAFIDKSYNADFGGKMTAISFPNLEIIQQDNIEIIPEEEK